MKIKYLFLAFLFIGSLASCSDDNGGVDIPEYKQIETHISIAATANDKVLTKAGVTEENPDKGTDRERYVHTLTAYLFYENGDLAGTSSATSDGQNSLDRIKDITVKVEAMEAGEVSRTKLQMVILANATPSTPISKLDDLKKASFTGIAALNISGANLPMGSEVIQIPAYSLVTGTGYNNWIDNDGSLSVKNTLKGAEVNGSYSTVRTEGNKVSLDANGKPVTNGAFTINPESQGVKLTRYVAKVQLEELIDGFTANYPGASFQLEEVAMVNVSNATAFVSRGGDFPFESVIKSGDAYTDQAFWRGLPATIDRKDYFIAQGQQDDAFLKKYESDDRTLENGKTLSFGANGLSQAKFYVFEFGKISIPEEKSEDKTVGNWDEDKTINTTLVIGGTWTNGAMTGKRYFRIPIRYNTNGDYGVLRNYIYKVHATLTAEGTPNPDENRLNAFVSFSIKVDPWEVIKQEEDDVN